MHKPHRKCHGIEKNNKSQKFRLPRRQTNIYGKKVCQTEMETYIEHLYIAENAQNINILVQQSGDLKQNNKGQKKLLGTLIEY